jgi:acyl-CoA thioester hydrolase
MTNAETGELAATCELTGVHLDQQARKAVPFADVVREAARKLIAEPATA